MKPAFSTVALPDWTLDEVAARAEGWGYLGVELRSFGYGSRDFACDPGLTSPQKTRGLFDRAGIEVCSIGTSIRYDAPVTPPVIGHVLKDGDAAVRETKGAVDLASRLGCPYVRVFLFEVAGSERRGRAVSRIAERLTLAASTARNMGVRLLIENGGSFPRAADLAGVLDLVANPLVAAAYNVGVGAAAGESPEHGINVLGESLAAVKLTDLKGGRPCAIGEGELPTRQAVEALARAGFPGWLVVEHPVAWLGGSAEEAATLLAASARTLYGWMGRPRSVRPAARVAVAG